MSDYSLAKGGNIYETTHFFHSKHSHFDTFNRQKISSAESKEVKSIKMYKKLPEWYVLNLKDQFNTTGLTQISYMAQRWNVPYFE